MWMESRVGLNPTPKTDEHGDDGDGYYDKDEMKSRPNPNEIEYQNSRVGLSPTPKTDEHGDDGDGYNDKDEMNRHMKMQVKMKLRPNRNEVESQNANCEEIPTKLNLKFSRPTPLI